MVTDWFNHDLRVRHGLPYTPLRSLQLGGDPEDFLVDEMPAFPFTGNGEHLYLRLEKRKSSSDFVARSVARCLGVAHKDVSYAGQKDTQAITRQWFSVYWPTQAEPTRLDARLATQEIRLLDQTRHTHKLRPGQHGGNRFSMALKSADPVTNRIVDALTDKLDHLAAHGAPNYFGPQRFGRTGSNAELGRLLLDRNPAGFLDAFNVTAERPVARVEDVPFVLRRLFVTAYQSHLFNTYLAERADRFNQRIPGDLLLKGHRSFHDDGSPELANRLSQEELFISGPIFGPKMRQARDEAGELEARILKQQSIGIEAFRHNRLFPRAQGARRPLWFFPKDVKIAPEDGQIRLDVTLPGGSFATVLLGLLTDHYGAVSQTLTAGA